MTIQKNIRDRLKNIIKEEFIESWLNTPNKSLNNKKPIDVILEHNTDEIEEILYRLESGIPN